MTIKIKHVFITPEKYHALKEKNPGYLYFLTNGELYRGDIFYGSQVSIIDNSTIPMSGSPNKIYYNKDDRSLTIWRDGKWEVISPMISNSIDLTAPGDKPNANIVTVDAIKKYINKLIETGKILSATDGAVSNLPISNIKVQKDIPIVNQNIGNYKEGDTVLAGTSVEDIIKNILTKVIPVNYKKPKVALSPANILVEAGTEKRFTFNIDYNPGNGGKVKSISIFKGINNVFTEPLFTSKYLIKQYTVNETDIIGDSDFIDYKVVVEYEDGKLEQNSAGELQEEGAIKAGSVEAICRCIGKRATWFQSISEDKDAMTSTDIRELEGTALDIKKGSAFSLDVNIGDKSVIIAIPRTLGNLTSITSHTLHMDITSNFKLTNVMVEGVNGYRAIDYNVYKYTPNIPFVSKDTFDVVI